MTKEQEYAKRYLFRIANIPYSIDTKKEELERLRNMIEGLKAINYDKDAVQTSPEDRMSEGIIKLVELTDKIDADVQRFADEYSDTMIIFEMMDSIEADILNKHFFGHKTFQQITNEFNHKLKLSTSERQVIRWYEQALETFARFKVIE